MGWIPCSGKLSGRTKTRRNSDEKLSRNCSVSTGMLFRTMPSYKLRFWVRPFSSQNFENSLILKNTFFFFWVEKAKAKLSVSESKSKGSDNIVAQTFTFSELATATRNFRKECLIGEGGFGRVYKGYLPSTSQTAAIKQLDHNGLQGNREFLVEVLMLSLLHHPNLVNLIGYCADGDQRLLVYEYMPLGSLEDHLHDISPGKQPLDWNTRMKIAAGAAKGLEYLHDKTMPSVIYRDLKCSNILLGDDYHPKLSDFGLAKLGPARPLFKDRRKFAQMADPMLQGQYPPRGLYQALAVAAMCVQEQPNLRPLIADVVTALTYLASQKFDPMAQPVQGSLFAPATPPRSKRL
ncbi:unnamed protein product [Thlaspi arvense]|uniref:non-specific serine/threonine protein kinase n=1 Tax=Thlaspi arvense TaxID=13288 RepID=A0AAU9SWL4_THLAR|nr:unnamed protein product [Thlaspi arvense]